MNEKTAIELIDEFDGSSSDFSGSDEEEKLEHPKVSQRSTASVSSESSGARKRSGSTYDPTVRSTLTKQQIISSIDEPLVEDDSDTLNMAKNKILNLYNKVHDSDTDSYTESLESEILVGEEPNTLFSKLKLYLSSNLNSSLFFIKGSSPLKFILDSLFILTTLYYAIEVPFGIVIFYFPPWWLVLIEFILWAYLTLTIILNSVTTDSVAEINFQLKGLRFKLLKDYLRSWFIIDFLAWIPIDLASLIIVLLLRPFIDQGSLYYGVYVYKFIRVIKFVRLLKIQYLFRTSNLIVLGKIKPYAIGMQFGFWFISSVHWVACIWMLLRENEGLRYTLFNRYLMSLYWAVTTLTTVGYGDVVVDTNTERIYCIFVMMFGVAAYGFVIGNISLFLMKTDSVRNEQQRQVRELASVMEFYSVPEHIQTEVMAFQQYSIQQTTIDNYEEIIKSLPLSMQNKIYSYVKIKIISEFPLFDNLKSDCLTELAGALQQLYVDPKEDIITYDTTGREMYFIAHGHVEVLNKLKEQVAVLHGGFFGEIALFYDIKRTATIRAITYCSLFKLEKSDFLKILSKYPQLANRVKDEMKQRVESMNQLGARRRIAQFNLSRSNSSDLMKISLSDHPDQKSPPSPVLPAGPSEFLPEDQIVAASPTYMTATPHDSTTAILTEKMDSSSLV